MFRSVCCGLLIGFMCHPAWSHDESAKAHYLGNEGLLISHGAHKILFDAFYENGYGTYVLVDPQTQKKMMSGLPPYDGVDALFISHVHGDHFTAAPTLKYLSSNAKVQLYASGQVLDVLFEQLGKKDAQLTERFHRIELTPGDKPVWMKLGELEIEALAIPHSGGVIHAAITNIVFRISLGDAPVVMHMGDAAPIENLYTEQSGFFERVHTNTVFPPYWFYGNDPGEKILKSHIRADQVIGIHVPAEARGQGGTWRARAGGDLFTDPGETRELIHEHGVD